MEQDKFRHYFSEKVTPDRNRWHDFQNNLNEYYLRELLTRMETFREELVFVLNNTDIPKDRPFEFLKQLSAGNCSPWGAADLVSEWRQAAKCS
jgi:hypothetical protein